MDLFGDLPEPTSEFKKNVKNVGQEHSIDGCSSQSGEKRKLDQVDEKQSSSSNYRAGQVTPYKRLSTEMYRLQAFHAENKGEREEMQDAFVICDDFKNEIQYSDRSLKPSWKDGTTAVTILAINNTLYISNLGDSKAVLCRYSETKGQYIAVPLTKDHNPAQYEERMRIQKSGGFVRDGRLMGVLEVSRSIGDGPYKKHGVICLPDVKKCQLTNHDKYVIIACDGLWKTFTPDAAIEFTNKIIEDASITGTELKSAEDLRWETACVRLVGEAVHRLSADNVTVVIIRIQARR
ncbi:hypothetical protein LSH36_486g03052 [Paralvinella palmiformis]|uniref:PPM-type phosphatase domain-containing protein n=1 Tax=Paralvinella palmiformis TaxID=53620 RepID=A0AAD9MX49_9ANNE|nr:hypothetical protein LSH36_486g03052 [Paralvinella palmiformis]